MFIQFMRLYVALICNHAYVILTYQLNWVFLYILAFSPLAHMHSLASIVFSCIYTKVFSFVYTRVFMCQVTVDRIYRGRVWEPHASELNLIFQLLFYPKHTCVSLLGFVPELLSLSDILNLHHHPLCLVHPTFYQWPQLPWVLFGLAWHFSHCRFLPSGHCQHSSVWITSILMPELHLILDMPDQGSEKSYGVWQKA
jgi:hypothetical protein